MSQSENETGDEDEDDRRRVPARVKVESEDLAVTKLSPTTPA